MKTIKKINIIFIVICMATMILTVVFSIHKINSLPDLLSGDFVTEVTFREAKFLGRYDRSYSTRYGGFYDVKVEKYQVLDTGETIELSYSGYGRSVGPSVIMGIRKIRSKEGILIKTEYEIYSDENFFLGRIGLITGNEEFYIYDKINNLQLKTNILKNFEKFDKKYKKDLMNVRVYHNEDSRIDKDTIQKLLSGEDSIYIKEKAYYKLESYGTEYGTMYILSNSLDGKSSYISEYVGILKYGEKENQELIFDVSYEYMKNEELTEIIRRDFRKIVEEKSI